MLQHCSWAFVDAARYHHILMVFIIDITPYLVSFAHESLWRWKVFMKDGQDTIEDQDRYYLFHKQDRTDIKSCHQALPLTLCRSVQSWNTLNAAEPWLVKKTNPKYHDMFQSVLFLRLLGRQQFSCHDAYDVVPKLLVQHKWPKLAKDAFLQLWWKYRLAVCFRLLLTNAKWYPTTTTMHIANDECL